VSRLSPSRLYSVLATVRTVASVWQVHKQNTNARDIVQRAGLLYDKFVGFTDNLKAIGMRLKQARKVYDDAYSQLSGGSRNLVGQMDNLSKLGARHAKQLDAGLLDKADSDETDTDSDNVLEIIKDDDAHRLSVKEKDELI